MKDYYSISIPKPCHEDWKQMAPKEKGRFCDSCAKTVIDFTKMGAYEIQNFINENKSNRICGRFRQSQLDSINIHIPSQVLENQQSFHKLFLLVLLIAMGTSLMNCTNKNGNKQKIDSVEVIDSINNNVIDVLGGLPIINEIDSIPDQVHSSPKNKEKIPIPEIITSVGMIELTGDVVMIEIRENPIKIDSIKVLNPPESDSLIICPAPDSDLNKNIIIRALVVETPPEFKNTPQNLSVKEKRDYFKKGISNFVLDNFNITQGHITLTGKQKIHVQFKIDSLGFVKDIKSRAPHSLFEKEAKRIIQLLPQFIPAKQDHEPVTVVYTFPIVFQLEE